MVVEKDFILAAYCEEFSTLDHEGAVAQVAALTGQPVEVIESVISEEATA